ncbi:hypothetical protein SEA_SCHMIDT_23 [Gordonia phage Schmidt]|uniref:Uncharacterized protein n=1 Tax=Gordonia phage Schmidt TaxID=2301697 RepID=A0A385E2P4_9CAUD|nr:hypothetical protein KDJ59_gp23 [Gordonia phage Schmidt]AXQ65145.1 hypothetical protein SEA_SCHMIDT_23 [Gordonia phage Schmidt]
MDATIATHPVVVAVGVISAVVAAVLVTYGKVRDAIARFRRDRADQQVADVKSAAEVEQARIETRAQIEAAAAILNDQRVRLLTDQLHGISVQIKEQRQLYESEMTALREQLADTQTALDEALAEIGELREELAAYRLAHADDEGAADG